MAQFPSAEHLVSWAKLSPRTIQSGPRSRSGKVGKGNPYLKRVLGEAAKTDTFLPRRALSPRSDRLRYGLGALRRKAMTDGTSPTVRLIQMYVVPRVGNFDEIGTR